jgi:integrase
MKKITTYMNGTDREMTCGKHKLPYIMSKKELVNTLVASSDIRLGMVMFVGVFQGLRIGEIIRLKWEHIDLFHGEIRVLDAKIIPLYIGIVKSTNKNSGGDLK